MLQAIPQKGRRRFLALAAGGAALAATGQVARVRAEILGEPGPSTIFVAETGHHIGGPILQWWLQYGRDSTIGWPITEPLQVGRETLQYFERGALRTDATATDPLGVVPLNLGTSWALRRMYPDRPHEYEWWFSKTERGVHEMFWNLFREGGAAFTYGYPVLWAAQTRGGLRQAFGRAVWTDTSRGILAEPIGVWEAERHQLDTSPVDQSVAAVRFEAKYWPTHPVYASDRRAEVDLKRQVATFYAADRPVYQALISTGVPPDFTPEGEYRIFMRHERTRLVSNGSTFRTYNMPDVLHVQYFTKRWIGFHYAYWHDRFGELQSAGCVNMRLHDSQWAWNFCSNGTPVAVHPGVPPPAG